MKCSSSTKRLSFIFILLIIQTIPFFFTMPASLAETPIQETVKQRSLNRTAARSLWYLERAIKRDGFFSARVNLNIWRETAKDAGNFDPEKYNAFKRAIYEKSIKQNLLWFDRFVAIKDKKDANTCLQLWRLHAKEIGVYDPKLYQAMKDKIY